MRTPLIVKIMLVMLSFGAVVVAGICGLLVVVVAGHVIDLNLGVESAVATSGPQRLGMIAMLALVGLGMVGCAGFAQLILRKVFRKQRHLRPINVAIVVIAIATSVAFFFFGRG